MFEFIFNEVAVLKACNFIQQRFQHKCFPVNTAKSLRTTFFKEHPGGCFGINPLMPGVHKRPHIPTRMVTHTYYPVD